VNEINRGLSPVVQLGITLNKPIRQAIVPATFSFLTADISGEIATNSTPTLLEKLQAEFDI
jgi:hypothetical protein